MRSLAGSTFRLAPCALNCPPTLTTRSQLPHPHIKFIMSSFTGMKFSLGGSKPSSSSNKPSFKPSKPSTLGKRPITALHDDSDSEDDRAPREVALEGFDEKGAVATERTPEKPLLVIPKLEKEDWREQVRKRRKAAEKRNGGAGKNLLPPEVQRQRDAEAKGLTGEEGRVEKPKLEYGLQTTAKEDKKEETSGDAPAVQEQAQKDAHPEAEELPKSKTDDERALDALLGRSSEPKKDLVIEQDRKDTKDESDDDIPTDPRDIYKRQIAAAPEPSTLEDYERIPVEEFGAALLRGMGWDGVKKEGKGDVKRRPNLLGLGAKELKGAEELGAWVQKADVKRLNNSGRGPGKERRETTSQYREREAREKRERDGRNGGSSYRDDRRDDRDSRDRRDERYSRSERDSRDSRDYRDRERDRRR